MSAGGFYSVGAHGITLRVRARPGSRRDAIGGVRDRELLVEVRAQPEKGKANQEVIKVLARALGLPRERIVLKLGGTTRRKVLELPVSCLGAVERLQAGLQTGGTS